MSVRVRFASRPTGALDITHARTALFNWLFARGSEARGESAGTFILRLEDSGLDSPRGNLQEDQLIGDLAWLGLRWDEGPDLGGPFGPYRQSERRDIYKRYTNYLLDRDQAYYCFCPEQGSEQEERPPHAADRCAGLSRARALGRRAAGEPAGVRLRIPQKTLHCRDLIRGDMEFSHA